jgi:hypothetical protein
MDPKKGTLVRPVIQIEAEMMRVEDIIGGSGNCLVVGDTPKGKLVTQVIKFLSGYSAIQMSEETFHSTANSPDIAEYDLLVEVTGSEKTAKHSIQRAKQGTVILLLGKQYEEFNLTDKEILEKTVMKPKIDSNRDVGGSIDTIDTMSNLEVDSILNGTYDMEEFNTARHLAKESEQFPLISVKS